MSSAPREQTTCLARAIKILPVEDERIIARHLQSRLQQLGYEVTDVAGSMDDALRLSKTENPDVVLMDIHLNGKSEGIEAAGHIRDQFDIPVIYLTAHSDAETIERASSTGPFGYLLKPFDDRELQVAIETAVHKHKLEKQLQDAEDRLRLAQQAGRVGVFDWDLETGQVFLTAELRQLFDIPYSTTDDNRSSWLEHIHPDDQDGVLKRLNQWMESDDAEQVWEHRILRAETDTRWVEMRGRIYRNSAGRATRIIGTQLDITARKAMQETLLEGALALERSKAELQARQNFMSSIASGAKRMDEMIDGLLELSRSVESEPRQAEKLAAVQRHT